MHQEFHVKSIFTSYMRWPVIFSHKIGAPTPLSCTSKATATSVIYFARDPFYKVLPFLLYISIQCFTLVGSSITYLWEVFQIISLILDRIILHFLSMYGTHQAKAILLAMTWALEKSGFHRDDNISDSSEISKTPTS